MDQFLGDINRHFTVVLQVTDDDVDDEDKYNNIEVGDLDLLTLIICQWLIL